MHTLSNNMTLSTLYITPLWNRCLCVCIMSGDSRPTTVLPLVTMLVFAHHSFATQRPPSSQLHSRRYGQFVHCNPYGASCTVDTRMHFTSPTRKICATMCNCLFISFHIKSSQIKSRSLPVLFFSTLCLHLSTCHRTPSV